MRKPIIAMDLENKGQGGGPYTSTSRIMNSGLKEKFNFVEIEYDPYMSKGVSVRRILNLRRQILNLKPDIVHYTGLQLSGFHIAIACLLAGVSKTIVTIRGMSGDAIDFHPLKRVLLTYLLEPFTLLLSKKFTGVSDFVTSRRIARLFKYKCFGTIYNFPPEEISEKNPVLTQESFGLDYSDVVITSVGRINKEKGYHILEKAIRKFETRPHVKFIIVGEGAYLEEMKANLSHQFELGQILFLGYREDVQQINGLADIFVLPTLHETLSVALLEASMSKLPMIASDTGGVPEIFETGFNGELVVPGSVDELASAIELLVSNPEKRTKYGLNAYNKVKNKFSKHSIEQELEKLYSEVLSR